MLGTGSKKALLLNKVEPRQYPPIEQLSDVKNLTGFLRELTQLRVEMSIGRRKALFRRCLFNNMLKDYYIHNIIFVKL